MKNMKSYVKKQRHLRKTNKRKRVKKSPFSKHLTAIARRFLK